jgi:hypothetical protein
MYNVVCFPDIHESINKLRNDKQVLVQSQESKEQQTQSAGINQTLSNFPTDIPFCLVSDTDMFREKKKKLN